MPTQYARANHQPPRVPVHATTLAAAALAAATTAPSFRATLRAAALAAGRGFATAPAGVGFTGSNANRAH